MNRWGVERGLLGVEPNGICAKCGGGSLFLSTDTAAPPGDEESQSVQAGAGDDVAPERRGFARMNVYVPLEIRYTDTEGKRRREATHSVNISDGGVFALTSAGLAPGACVKMTIRVPAGEEGQGRRRDELECRARVIHVTGRIRGFGNKALSGAGFAFLSRFRRVGMDKMPGAPPSKPSIRPGEGVWVSPFCDTLAKK